ncbi:helix-turn-helix transcriptional regulator [Paracoccus jeotgali]|uniref:helix-turn-helix transcriptional regulator n=1 Tax=Paracoccus jeotgali TaxID=2065379 RepID=UPI0035E43648
MRPSQIIGPGVLLPISRSTFYAKVAAGELPQPHKLGARISVWRNSDIIAFIEKGSAFESWRGQRRCHVRLTF